MDGRPEFSLDRRLVTAGLLGEAASQAAAGSFGQDSLFHGRLLHTATLPINTGSSFPYLGGFAGSFPVFPGSFRPPSTPGVNSMRQFWPPTPPPDGYSRYNTGLYSLFPTVGSLGTDSLPFSGQGLVPRLGPTTAHYAPVIDAHRDQSFLSPGLSLGSPLTPTGVNYISPVSHLDHHSSALLSPTYGIKGPDVPKRDASQERASGKNDISAVHGKVDTVQQSVIDNRHLLKTVSPSTGTKEKPTRERHQRTRKAPAGKSKVLSNFVNGTETNNSGKSDKCVKCVVKEGSLAEHEAKLLKEVPLKVVVTTPVTSAGVSSVTNTSTASTVTFSHSHKELHCLTPRSDYVSSTVPSPSISQAASFPPDPPVVSSSTPDAEVPSEDNPLPDSSSKANSPVPEQNQVDSTVKSRTFLPKMVAEVQPQVELKASTFLAPTKDEPLALTNKAASPSVTTAAALKPTIDLHLCSSTTDAPLCEHLAKAKQLQQQTSAMQQSTCLAKVKETRVMTVVPPHDCPALKKEKDIKRHECNFANSWPQNKLVIDSDSSKFTAAKQLKTEPPDTSTEGASASSSSSSSLLSCVVKPQTFVPVTTAALMVSVQQTQVVSSTRLQSSGPGRGGISVGVTKGTKAIFSCQQVVPKQQKVQEVAPSPSVPLQINGKSAKLATVKGSEELEGAKRNSPSVRGSSVVMPDTRKIACVVEEKCDTTVSVVPSLSVLNAANQSIPVGIAVAQQRQDHTVTCSKTNMAANPPEQSQITAVSCSTVILATGGDRNVTAREPKISQASQGVTESATCLVTSGPNPNTNQWDQDSLSRPSLPWLTTATTPVVTPTVWLGQGTYSPAPLNTTTDSSSLPIASNSGFQLARDSLTGQLYLVPTGWTLTSNSGPAAPFQQILTQQHTTFQHIIPQPVDRSHVTDLSLPIHQTQTQIGLTKETVVETSSMKCNQTDTDDLMKQELKDVKPLSTMQQLGSSVPLAHNQSFGYGAYSNAQQSVVSYIYDPSVVQLNQTTTAIQTEPGKRSQGTSPLNSASPPPLPLTANEQGVQASVSDEGTDANEDESEEEASCSEIAETVLTSKPTAVTMAIQVDMDSQTTSDFTDADEPTTVRTSDSANQTDAIDLSKVSPVFEEEEDNQQQPQSVEVKSHETVVQEEEEEMDEEEEEEMDEEEEQEDETEANNQKVDTDDKSNEVEQHLDAISPPKEDSMDDSDEDKPLQVADDESAPAGKQGESEIDDSVPVLPAGSKPVMDFIDHHGLDLLVDSIEEFASRELEDMPHLEKTHRPESPVGHVLESGLNNARTAAEPPVLGICQSPSSSSLMERGYQTFDGSCTDGLGLLCALAEQRFLEETLNSKKNQEEAVQEKHSLLNQVEPKLKEVTHHYPPHHYHEGISEKLKSPTHLHGSLAQTPRPESPLPMDPAELEMRIQLAELQRKYKEKQRELAKLQPKKEKEESEKTPVKKLPGRPKKRRNSGKPQQPASCSENESQQCFSPVHQDDICETPSKRKRQNSELDFSDDAPKETNKDDMMEVKEEKLTEVEAVQEISTELPVVSEVLSENNTEPSQETEESKTVSVQNQTSTDETTKTSSDVVKMEVEEKDELMKSEPEDIKKEESSPSEEKNKTPNESKGKGGKSERKSKHNHDKSFPDDEIWYVRRSERIFLQDAGVISSSSLSASRGGRPVKLEKQSPMKKSDKKKQKESTGELVSVLKKCQAGEKIKGGLSPSQEPSDSDGSSSEGENIPLSDLALKNFNNGHCYLKSEDLHDLSRVVMLEDGLFYAGYINEIQAPDVYGITLDGERGNRPHIFSREEIFKQAVREVKPQSLRELPEGMRVCAYWSQQYRCLYPGTVAKATSPNPIPDELLAFVEFDDGDSGKIPLEDVRLLPQDYPPICVSPHPILVLNKKRRHTTDGSHDGKSSSDNSPCRSSEKIKVKKKKKTKYRKKSKEYADDDNSNCALNSTEHEPSSECVNENGENPCEKKKSKKNKESEDASSNALDGNDASANTTGSVKVKKHKKHKEEHKHKHHHKHHKCHHHHKHHKKHKSERKSSTDTVCSSITSCTDTSETPGDCSPPAVEGTSPASACQSPMYSSSVVEKKSELTLKLTTSPKVLEENDDESDAESDSSSSEDEKLVSESKGSQTNGKQKKAAKPAKRKERLPSVEKSKIAAFLPVRQLWRWSGKSFRRPGKGKGKKEFYKSICRGKETIRVGDCAVFLSTGRPHLPYIGRIETMWQSWGGNMVVRVKWFYHPEETKGKCKLDEPRGALFQSPHADENDVQTISHKCEVLSWEEYMKCMEKEHQDGNKFGFDNNDIYFLAGNYDPYTNVLIMEPRVP